MPAFLPPGLVPGAFDLAALGAMAVTFALLMLAGRLLTGGRNNVPLVDFVAGWGALCLVLTLWGAATETSMAWPAALVPLAAIAALCLPGVRPGRTYLGALGRNLALALPLLVLMASVLPGEVDTFLYWLPNAAYLHDHGMFPADDRIQHFSLYPAHPYSLTFLTYVAGLALPDFVRSGTIHANVLLNVLFVGALAQWVARLRAETATDTDGVTRGIVVPGWGLMALAFLFAMPLNPAFLPEFNLSSYGESTIGIALAVAVMAALEARNALLARRPAAFELATLALALAALVNIKQTSIVFTGGVMLGFAWLVWRDGRPALRAGLLGLAVGLPAIVEHGAWRLYVVGHFAHGENELLPRAQWHTDAIGQILETIAKESLEKGYFTAMVLASLALAVVAWRRRPRGTNEALPMMAAWLYGLNVLFLVTMYVIQFPGVMGPNAQSFYRYCTQNGPTFLLALAPLALAWTQRRTGLVAGLRRFAPVIVAAWLAAPFAGLFYLRYDQRMPVPLLWAEAEALAGPAKSGSALAIVVPTGDGNEWTWMRVAMQVTSPRRDDIRYVLENRANDAALARLAAQGFDRVMVSCVPPGLARYGRGGGVVLAREGDGWKVIARYDFPAAGAPGIWRAGRAEKFTGCG